MPAAAALRLLPIALILLAAGCGGAREERYERPAARTASAELDHVWLAADERLGRSMLAEAGFRFSGNRIVFENGFLELRPAAAAGAPPFGIAFRATVATPQGVVFESTNPAQVRLALVAQSVDAAANRAAIEAGGPAAEPFLHANNARRLTGVRVTAPTRAALPPAASFVNLSGAAELRVGSEWLMELELDHGTQNQELDLRPRLPLTIRF